MNPEHLHPDCPDWRRLGPDPQHAAVRAAAARVGADADARESMWSKGYTRRRVLAGGLGLGVAALGAQLVTSRVSFAAPGSTTGTLVVMFLRGGSDGLSVLVPAGDANLQALRPNISVPQSTLIGLDRGFGLHPAAAPLAPLVRAGKLAAVPAVSTPDLSRSHFQAQDCLERGGSATGAGQTGWLDRVVEQSGPGTTFRSMGLSHEPIRALIGDTRPVITPNLDALKLNGDDATSSRTRAAIGTLYTGIEDGWLADQATSALAVSARAAKLTATNPATSGYPQNDLGGGLASLATLIKDGAGVRVAAIDVGGWDMHTALGTVDRGDMKDILGGVSAAIAAFFADLGSTGDNVTLVTMSEFGRRVEQNASGGLDHGHGGVTLIMGGNVTAGVHGAWKGLDPSVLDDGDVPGTNDYRDVLSDVVAGRLGLSSTQLQTVFPGWRPSTLGIMR